MAKRVKCKYCGQEFDRELTEFVKVSNRYAHRDCYDKAQLEAAELRKVTDLIKSLYYPQEPNWNVIGSQLQRYRDEGKTYMGMYYTLTYFFTIQKNDIHKGAGVGIIPYVYDRAKAYYKNLDNTYTKAAEIEQREKIDVEQTENIVTIIHKKPAKKLLDFNYGE
jgi:hypothetical protein